MTGYWDIHNHILPGVDDGSGCMRETMEMLEEEYRQGVRHIVFTPHYRRDMFAIPREEIQTVYARVCEMAADRFPEMEFYLGCEYYIHSDASVERLRGNPKYYMAGSRTVLMEFAYEFSAMMYEMMGWNLDCRYKILGHKITFEDETIYVFDLMETEIFLDIKGKRAKKDTESQSTTESANNIEETVSSNTDNERSAEEIKRKNRIPFYPKEWKDSFGLPVEEHRKALEINMLDGYAEFTTGK